MRSAFYIGLIVLAAVIFSPLSVIAQKSETPAGGMIENKGQWPSQVTHSLRIPAGNMFIEKGGFTYHFSDFGEKLHERKHSLRGKQNSENVLNSVVRMQFTGEVRDPILNQADSLNYHLNYFLGNDPGNWAEKVQVVQSVTHKELYAGVNMHTTFNGVRLKYELHLKAGSHPSVIGIEYSGQQDIGISSEGQLKISTPLCEIVESAPVAYQIIDGEKREVGCRFAIEGSTVKFEMGSGYDPAKKLVIDPQISFSSYVGSSADNFGFTATYDDEGSLYGGGIVFGNGYPTTTGTYDSDFNDGNIDIGISKFAPDGTELEYSTYIGGSESEAPHSLVVNEQNELFILGTTGSSNFPTVNAYQSSFNGGTNVNTSSGFNYQSGSDICIAKLSADGGSLSGSTYLGGNQTDGINIDDLLDYNYGDNFRGEIIVAPNGHILASSVTRGDFPVTSGAWQPTYGGGDSDGCIFRLTPDLSNLVRSTYMGGSGSDALYGIQNGDDNSIYVTGGSESSDIDVPGDAYQSTNQGSADGIIARFSGDLQNLESATYTGNSSYNQCYFVQVDPDGNVYVVGQKVGLWPVSDNVYTNENGAQFIQKFNSGLSELLISTEIGTGSGAIDFSPSAFLVSNCGQVYVSGWGGGTNSFSGNATQSTTTGLPVTTNAFQPSTDGEDFYLMVFDNDVTELAYATFFGGPQSGEHVDGGTSRFDKNGTVYQAVCSGCGGNDDFPSQPGVWSQTNPSTNCNLGVFKFELSQIITSIEAPEIVCLGQEVNFQNQSNGSDTYEWDFGDGNTSTEANPTHSYNEPGTYDVTLVASDSQGCLAPDDATFTIEVDSFEGLQVEEPEVSCPGDSVQLSAMGADTYSWSPTTGISNPDSPNPMAAPSATQTYTLNGEGFCGEESLEITVEIFQDEISLTEDTTICPSDEVVLETSGASDVIWSPEDNLSSSTGVSVTASPGNTITYNASGISPNGCEVENDVTIYLLGGPPELEVPDEMNICEGDSTSIPVEGADSYEWQNTPGLNDIHSANPTIIPPGDIEYVVTGHNQCGSDTETIPVFVRTVDAQIYADTVTCEDEPTEFSATGGVTYTWQPGSAFDYHQGANVTGEFDETTEVVVTVFDKFGCYSKDSAFVLVHPLPPLYAGNDFVIEYGESAQFNASSPFDITWESDETLSCMECEDPVATPLETSSYFASAISPEGCEQTDTVTVEVLGSLYVPNAFTPNGDGINDIFKAKGISMEEFHMEIFNRWGEHIYTIDGIENGWNGSIKDGEHFARNGVYIWKLRAKDINGPAFERQGTVTLIR